MRTIIYGIVFTMLFGSKGHITDSPVTSFFVSDTLEIELYTIYDSLGVPDKYMACVESPVCEIDKCYAIELQVYWDLIGRFYKYDTLPGQGLTKLDHVPFTTDDYTRLTRILSDPYSGLSRYSKEELIGDTRTSELDGITGATIEEIRGSVINGAVYSCYTLWHIVHGSVVDSLRMATVSSLDKPLINKLVDINDDDVGHFLINNFSDENFEDFLPEVLRLIEHADGYLAKNAIEQMPKNVIMHELSQGFFAQNFEELTYFEQVALLRKLNKDGLMQDLKNTLSRSLDDRNSYKNELIQKLTEN